SHDEQEGIGLGKGHPKIEGHTRGRRQDECDEILRIDDSLHHALACDFCVEVMGASFRAACCCCFLQFMKCLSLHSTIFRAELTTWSGVLSINVAYFSTTRATGSSNSYSRFTCCGGLLMIDMCFLLFASFCYLDTGKTLRKQSLFLFAGWSDPMTFWPAFGCQKWGRSSPRRCFARVQIQCRATRNLYAPNNFASPSG